MNTETSLREDGFRPERTPDIEPGVGTWRPPGANEHRSPCPALNALANGGYIPRSGEVTAEQLVRALHERLGIPVWLGRGAAARVMGRLGRKGPGGVVTLDLADLGEHGFLEHDASLTRRDARHGNATLVREPLVKQLLAVSNDGRSLTVEDLATAHQIRMAQSAADGHRVPLKAAIIGTFEAALLYQVLRKDQSIVLADAREILERERIPLDVVPRKLEIGKMLLTAIKLALMGSLPFGRAAKRIRDAKESLATAPARCPFTKAPQHAG